MSASSRIFTLETVELASGQRGWQGKLVRPDGESCELELRVSGGVRTPPAISDGLAIAFLPVVMRSGGTLHVRGTLTRGALRNLTEFAEAWASWKPGAFHRVRITADSVLDGIRVPDGREAVFAWAGDLRSTHTLLRHHAGVIPGPFRVRAALRIVGLRPGEDAIATEEALDRARNALRSDDIPLLTVRTNAASGGLIDPEIGVLPIVVASLHAVSGDCAAVVHTRSWSFLAQMRFPRPAPALHDLLAGDALAVRADGGADAPPTMAALVCQHPALAAVVSDCGARPRGAAPCGECPECTLMALAFLNCRPPSARATPKIRSLAVAKLPFADATVAGDAQATLAAWNGGHRGLYSLLRASTAVAQACLDVRDHLRWAGAASGLTPPWPR